jgi:tRNA-specific 2-thiouridylase
VTLDLEDVYKREVVDYMIAEYRAGRTPNPDVMCNRYVKFGGFFDWAMKQGADYVATGHYAQIVKKNDTVYELHAGDDRNKDQSYFLWTLGQRELSRTLFPVGHIEKPAVRKLAATFKLPTATKKDSQGLCFIGKIDIKDFLSRYIETKPGNVLDEKGQRIGSHDGAVFFTIGERHGFIIDAERKTPNDNPYYVVSKNILENTITVAAVVHDGVTNSDTYGGHTFAQKEISLEQTNWNTGVAPTTTATYYARPRYRAALVSISIKDISPAKKSARIIFTEPQQNISSGQSLVIYADAQGEVCIGGGIIA